jgi:hypothetical protein
MFNVYVAVFSVLVIRSYCFCPFQRRELAAATERASTPEVDQKPNEDTELLGQIPMSSDLSDPYVRANDFFHNSYDDAKNNVVPKVNIMSEGDYLVLHRADGSKLIEQIAHDIYHNLKMVSHFPLGAYTILLTNTSKSVHLDERTVGQFAVYLQLLEGIDITADRFPDAAMRERQQLILDVTTSFVKEMLSVKECSLECMATFAWSMSGEVNENLDDAAEDTMNSTHIAVTRWKNEVLSSEEWDQLYVAVAVG